MCLCLSYLFMFSEDQFKDTMLSSGHKGEVTTIKRINSHTQLFTRSVEGKLE